MSIQNYEANTRELTDQAHVPPLARECSESPKRWGSRAPLTGSKLWRWRNLPPPAAHCEERSNPYIKYHIWVPGVRLIGKPEILVRD